MRVVQKGWVVQKGETFSIQNSFFFFFCLFFKGDQVQVNHINHIDCSHRMDHTDSSDTDHGHHMTLKKRRERLREVSLTRRRICVFLGNSSLVTSRFLITLHVSLSIRFIPVVKTQPGSELKSGTKVNNSL